MIPDRPTPRSEVPGTAEHRIQRIAQELGISRRAVQRAQKEAQNPPADFGAKGAISRGLPLQ